MDFTLPSWVFFIKVYGSILEDLDSRLLCKWMGIRGMPRFPRERVEPPRTLTCGVSPSTLFPQESRHSPPPLCHISISKPLLETVHFLLDGGESFKHLDQVFRPKLLDIEYFLRNALG
jgi:hypothetical protein